MNLVIPVRENLELRLRSLADADAVFEVTNKNRAYLREWLPWVDSTKNPEDTREYIQSCILKFEKEEGLDLGIWYNGKWVGSIGFHYWDKANRKDTIGYWLAEDAQGKGIMTDAVRALVNYGFQTRNLNRIEILCAVDNIKSQAIPKRLDFKDEGITRDCEWLYDHFVDSVTYSILAREWKPNNS